MVCLFFLAPYLQVSPGLDVLICPHIIKDWYRWHKCVDTSRLLVWKGLFFCCVSPSELRWCTPYSLGVFPFDLQISETVKQTIYNKINERIYATYIIILVLIGIYLFQRSFVFKSSPRNAYSVFYCNFLVNILRHFVYLVYNLSPLTNFCYSLTSLLPLKQFSWCLTRNHLYTWHIKKW